ncbi:FAM10 family protein [Camellia lanceoleosa]|uniref:FAM10 family protein n=1 Tax=Camellia lanceoleosa TaxID=1840588 RepID=A0ACC0FY78_9ERIC|nr:FAM10 family protein [Camellia lanceoleosa]
MPYVVEESNEDLEDNEKEPQPHGAAEEEEESKIVESDLELEGETMEPDNDLPQKMADPSIKVIEENRDAAQHANAKAMETISEGKHEEEIEHLTQAILLNPTSVIMYVTRASVYIKMKKPNAVIRGANAIIRGANAALEINPDLAKRYKSHGMALAMLGQWREAAKDLHLASKLDQWFEFTSF